MTRPIKASELEQIMAEALAELMHQAQRAQGIRNAEHTRRRAEEWRSGPRSPLGATGPRSCDVSDPTGNARPDDGDAMADNLTAAWRRIHKDLRALRTISAGIHSHASTVTRATHSQVRLCAVPWCRDDIISPLGQVPDRGRCEPCANYYRRHGEDPGPATIEARRRKRAERERV
jgi:hypothetical protein